MRGRLSDTGIGRSMKLLFSGSLFVLTAVIAWAAVDWGFAAASAVNRRIDLGPPVFGSVSRDSTASAIVWQTSTAPEDCAYVVEHRRRDEARQLAALIGTDTEFAGTRADGDPCAPFQLGAVPEGIKVEIVGECGRMAKVKILSGDLRGRVGCLDTARLTDVGS